MKGSTIVFFFVIALCFLVGSGGDKNVSTISTQVPVENNSFEHRYVKERFKLEGYSNKESKQAADAIIKFNNAQKNRHR